jgi:hypothetical protein
MKRGILFASATVIMIVGSLLAGCGAKPSTPPTSTKSPLESEVSNALAKLSPEDRAQAETQKICPVSKEPLGSMGEPIKVTVDGRSLFVCCEGCIDDLKANFAKYADEVAKQL